jgi:hypothetical protein
MTFVGKLFVMVNVALSLCWAVAAFGLYVTSMDWGYERGKAGTPGGILKEKTDEIKRLQAQQFSVEEGWREARVELRRREDVRRGDRSFYAEQFAHNRDKANAASPARAVKRHSPKVTPLDPEHLRNSIAVLDKNGRPVLEDARERAGQPGEPPRPLLSLVIYDEQLKQRRKQNEDILIKLKAEFEKDITETNRLLDAPPRKGLRTQLAEEKAKYEGIVEEQRLAQPLYVNTTVELDLVQKRIESLDERIKELESYMKKRKMDVKVTRR